MTPLRLDLPVGQAAEVHSAWLQWPAPRGWVLDYAGRWQAEAAV